MSLPAISNVSVAPLPNIGIQSSASLICVGQSAVLTPSGAVSYSISGGNFTISPTVTTSYTIQATAASSCSNSVVYTQNVSACTSLQSTSQNLERIKVYPNPVQTFLNIEVNATTSATLEIINPLGQVIQRISLEESLYQLNMAELESGLYLLKINQSNEQRIIKVIKN